MSVYLAGFLVSALFFVLALKYMASRQLDFGYVVFWMILSVMLMWISFAPGVIDLMARSLGVYAAPNLLFMAGMIFVLAFIFYITLFITNITRRVVRLTQEVGILKQKLQKLQEEVHEKQ